jgi:hypothetical protein
VSRLRLRAQQALGPALQSRVLYRLGVRLGGDHASRSRIEESRRDDDFPLLQEDLLGQFVVEFVKQIGGRPYPVIFQIG